jgi:heterodisulfide reductase subunit A1
MKPGVFLCCCGGNISNKIDLDKVKKSVCEDVQFIDETSYLCSNEGMERIVERIKSEKPDGIVIAACSPRMHEKRFRGCAERADMNRYMVDIANIREQCAWVSKDSDPTVKAIDLINSSIYAVKNSVSLEKIQLPSTKSALVVGGGISGITASLSLAKHGIKVYLVEKSASIGGNMVKIGKVFSADTMSEECAMCSLGPLISEVGENPNIEVISQAEISEVKGHMGNFSVNIKTGPNIVNIDSCTSCGSCAEVCSINVPDEFNFNLTFRRAAYKPFSGALPSSYSIDPNTCIKCGKCVDVCPVNAINLESKSKNIELGVGAIILATGYTELNPELMGEFGYKKIEGVITQMELARLLAVNGPTSGKLISPLTGKKPLSIVMIQCVGSRDRKPGSIPHCSTICCMTALKHSNYIVNHHKGTEIYICYTDMRTPGTYENYYFETQKKGEKSLRFIRGKVAHVKKLNKDTLLARVEDTLGGGVTDIEADMVVLSSALMPSNTISDVQEATGISLTEEKFVKEKNSKMDPTQTTVPGIFVSGTAKGAMDITESINMSRSAASRVSEMLTQEFIEIEPQFAVLDHDKCNKCLKCLEQCPSNAIYLDKNVGVNPLVCTGCGYCISLCERQALSLPLYSDHVINARIDGVLKMGNSNILTFLDEKIAYAAADNMGSNKLEYPSDVRIIKVPSILRLETKHLLYGFKKGAKGIFLGDGTANASGESMNKKLNEKVQELIKGLSVEGIDPSRIFFYQAYLPHYKGMANKLKEFSRALEKIE